MGSEHNVTKRTLLERLLEQSMVMATVDARMRGVVVPDHLMGDPQLRLNLSYRFGLTMELTEGGVHATLTFGGVPFPCIMPWESIYLFVSHATGEPYFFPSDAPAGLFEEAPPGPDASADGDAEAPRFEVLPGEPPAEAEESAPRSPPKRGHLRVVK
jgi:stringent starvation protein B